MSRKVNCSSSGAKDQVLSPRANPKGKKTKEEKSFKRRSKYFLVAQLVSIVLFVTLMARADDAEIELDGDEGYE
ncbi:hypothetical protein ACE6H2_009577 [Prunus campanulata]